jgi:Rhs element Vgr protein
MLDLPNPDELKPKHTVTFTVSAGGVPLDPTIGTEAIEIHREVNRIPRATVVFSDGRAANQDFEVSSQPTLLPGVEIEIQGGYQSQNQLLFRGVVTRHRVEMRPRRSRLVIEAKDAAFRMTLARKSKTYQDQSDQDICSALISAWPGLSGDVQILGGPLPQIVQHQATDWDFMVMRAEQASAFVITENGTVKVAPPAALGLPAARAVFGETLRDAALELDAESELTCVDTGAWDPATQELTTAEATDATVTQPGDVPGTQLAGAGGAAAGLRHPGARDQAALDAWAAAEMTRGRRAAVRGVVTVQGNAALTPGALIDLGGLGTHFTGTGLITGIRHRLGHGDWETEVLIGADPRPHAQRFPVAAPAAGGQLPPVPGLQIAKVSALEGDPAGEGRIEIQLPTVTETDGLLWARIARFDAGDQRGLCWLPEVDDEVIVGFLDGDPRDPVVLGALHSSAAASALTASNDNHEKALVTRAGMRIHWNDDTVTLTIDTPAGNSIVLDEDGTAITLTDQNGSSVTLNADGIALDSGADVKITATGDVSIEGTNVTVKANAQLGAEGSSGAELKSSGTTVIKGSLVNIN